MPQQTLVRDGSRIIFTVAIRAPRNRDDRANSSQAHHYALSVELCDDLDANARCAICLKEQVKIDFALDDAAIARFMFERREDLIQRARDEAGHIRQTPGLDPQTRQRLNRNRKQIW